LGELATLAVDVEKHTTGIDLEEEMSVDVVEKDKGEDNKNDFFAVDNNNNDFKDVCCVNRKEFIVVIENII
jgi:hypothetical protein